MEVDYVKFELGYIEICTHGEMVKYIKYTKEHRFQNTTPTTYLSMLKKDLNAYLHGEPVNFNNYKLDLSKATHFENMVYTATSSIPYGKTKSYKQIAASIGKPKAFRAAGNALHKNPFLIVIPCHRVWRNNGEMGGFGAGVELKRYLCELEGITV